MAITKIDNVLYTAKSHTTGGRDGGAGRTSDGRVDVKFSVPGTPGTGTNPEQLFALGWSACFIGAMRVVAGMMKIRFPQDASVDMEVDLGTTNGGYFLQGRRTVNLPGLDAETAKKLVDGAEQECPYSKVTRGNINVVNTITTAASASNVA